LFTRHGIIALFCFAAFGASSHANEIFSRRESIAISPAAQAARERLEAIAAAPFRYIEDARGGRYAAIAGGLVLVPGEPAERATTFFREHAEVFGLAANVVLRAIPANTFDDRVTLELLVDGLAVENIRARVRFDGEALTSASLRSPPSFATSGAFALGRDVAAARATTAIDAHRAPLGKSRELAPPTVVEVWLPSITGLRAAYRIDRHSSRPGESWRIFVDGVDGSTTRPIDRIRHAEKGNLPVEFDGDFIFFEKFPLGDAKGNVFANQSAALNGLPTFKKIKNFATKGVPAAGVAKGFITGRIANVFDFYGEDPFEPNMVFDYDPFESSSLPSGIPLYDAFDCANIEYQLELFYAHLLKQLGVSKLASNLSMPVIVNSPSTEVNAFFSPSPFPDMDPDTLGFLEFFDLTETTTDIADDLSRDPIVACHEYTHAWLFYELLPFEDPVDFPPRAIGEAIPDFYATTFHKDNAVGRYTAIEMLGDVAIRTLQDDDRFPETTLESLFDHDPGPGVEMLPQEHQNGEIFGSLLLDARDVVGAKRIEQIVFEAMPDMPHTMLDVGFSEPAVLADPIAATERFFFECAVPLLSEAKNDKETGAIFGAGLGRGVFQNDGLFSLLLNLEFADDRKMTIPSVIPRANGEAKIQFHAKQGRKLKITLKASATDTLIPTYTLVASNGSMGAITAFEAPVISTDQKTITQANIQLNLPLGKTAEPGDPFYILTIEPVSGIGYYTITLDA
jgi:hypothetical protein